MQSVLNPAGPQASSIHELWLLMFSVTVVMFGLVLTFVFAALIRGVRHHSTTAPEISERAERGLSQGVAAAIAVTVVVLIALLAASVWTGRSVAPLHAASGVTIAVTGHQWWWEIEYQDATPSRRVLTANEIHIPTKQSVVLSVTSRDVIHSFWAPNLQGKRDLVPGYTTAIWMQVDQPGHFRGQCAEFCGLQHAHMAFDIVAEPQADFERWLDRMRQPAPSPSNDTERRGQMLFLSTRCAGCHTVRGTDAHGQAGPDLTHIATRTTLGAGTLSNTREHLDEWVRDPQASKPGNQMPPNPMAAENIGALLTYLETLR
jgi:cytochrome c oxidase subunit 2